MQSQITPRVCSVEGCAKLVKGHGRICSMHTARKARHGSYLTAVPPQERHHMTDSPTYGSWRAMLKRCTNPKHPAYASYGGRGITVCERWLHSFQNFLEDMGERPAGKTLDRKNNDLGYSPANCRWATWNEQARNKRTPTEPRVRGSHTVCMRGHEFTPETTYVYVGARTFRQCRVCRAEDSANYRARKRLRK